MTHLLLLVDDETQRLSRLEPSLAAKGYATRRASSVEGALDEATRRSAADALDVALVLVAAGPLTDVTSGADPLDALARHGTAARGVVLVGNERDAELLQRAHRVGLRDVVAGVDDDGFDMAVLDARLRLLFEAVRLEDHLRKGREAVAARNRELEAARSEQHELMEFLAHDLKNPMMVVTGNLEWIRTSEGISARHIEAIDDAGEAASRIRAMVENFLMVSRLEHAQFPLYSESVEVDTVLRTVFAGLEARARERHVQVSFSADPGLSVKVDPVLLSRVFKNMVDTALRHTPTSGRMALEAHRGNGIVIAISNSGPPIPAHLREHMFDKLARRPSTNDASSKLEDMGLGLYFCKCAVEAHSGHIGVVETGDWPNSFVIQLPAA